MANLGTGNHALAAATSLLIGAVLLLCSLHTTDAQVGVAYGNDGNNLPPPQDVVALCKSNGIQSMRIYYPDHAILNQLQNSGIKLTLGVGKADIQNLGSNPDAANEWVRTNVVPYASTIEIKYIVVGDEIKPADPLAPSVLPAMQNILNALRSNGDLGDRIRVSTSIGTELVVNAYPPSNGQFSDLSYMTPIIKFLKENGSPLMATIYPYFAHKFNPNDISLEYALFTMPQEKAVVDTNNQLRYQNVFDALADAIYAAIDKVVVAAAAEKDGGLGAEKVGSSIFDISLITSESGWSSGVFHRATTRLDAELADGGDGASVENARTYYTNLINHVKNGTPLKPGKPIETFLFAMFDEDNKPGSEDEHYFGIFDAQKNPKYGQLNFN